MKKLSLFYVCSGRTTDPYYIYHCWHMKSKAFKNLLKRYQLDQVTERERAMVDKWMELLSKDKDQIVADDQTGEEVKRALMERIKKDQNVRRLFPQWIRVAASIALLVTAASFAVWKWQATDIVNIQTVSETKKVILPDGSIIWLKENSSLSYPEKFNADIRQVSFSGEGLFEVAKDAKHPFIIDCNGATAKVVGTSFNIRSDSIATEVTVLTGKVSITATNSQQQIMVLPKEKAVYRKQEKQLAKATIKEEETRAVTNGTEYTMLFSNTPVKDIVQRIENKFDVKVELEDENMNQCVLTGDFTDHSLEETLTAIEQVLGFAYQIDGAEVVLKGKGCN